MEGRVELKGFDGTLAMVQSLPPEVVSKRGGPVKTGLRKGALVILREAALNLAHSTESLTGDSTTTGLVAKSLIVSRGKPPSGENGERYLVRVKKRLYPRAGETVSTQQSAEWLEYGAPGHNQPAEPWLRPALKSKAEEAIHTVETETLRAIDRVVAKLKRQGR